MIIFLVLWLAMPLSAEPLSENQARFGVIAGDVGLLSQGASDWIEPHEGLPIEPGDHIRTGEEGSVELVMSDNALWVLEPRTEVVMEHCETNAGRLDLSDGRLIGTVDSKRAAGTVQRWEFNTPAAVIAVRGTEFGIVASRQQGTRLGVFSGNVDIQPAETATGPQPSIEVQAGREAFSMRLPVRQAGQPAGRQGQPVQTFTKFSADMSTLAAKRQAVQRRQNVIENTWSPFTPSVRKELRGRFVSPAPKHSPVRRAAPRKRRRPPADS